MFGPKITFTSSEVSKYYAIRVPSLKRTGSGEWRGPCPIHEGNRDSFAVKSESGLWFCHSECGRGGSIFDLEMILTGADFRTAKSEIYRIVGRPVRRSRTGTKVTRLDKAALKRFKRLLRLRLHAYAESKGLQQVNIYHYRDANGRLAFIKAKFRDAEDEKTFLKFAPTPTGGLTTPKKAGIQPMLYGLNLLAGAGEIHLCNGEKAAIEGRKLGLVTTCLPDGEGHWDEGFTPLFERMRVVGYLDNDTSGEDHGVVLARALIGHASELRLVRLPGLPPKGDLYDWIEAGGTADKLRKIIDATPVVNSVPEPAPPTFKFLDEGPPALARPLAIVAGHSYAATWLWYESKTTEVAGKKGEIVRLDSPEIEKARDLFVIRDDGEVFGPGHKPLAELGFDVNFGDSPQEEKLWRAPAVVSYQRRRQKYVKLFARLASVYDHFIDFKRSLADQIDMCEFSACASLVTWFAPAFTVLPYFWPTGEKGSGKTKWGTLWAMTSYLGEVLLSSGSFAAIRDLAVYGGAMLFDDAEILSDPKKCDPNKRELLLAGNRRGAKVPLKEPTPDGRWATRWVPAFCPRGFTAIRTPDSVLSSRTIAIPLIRRVDSTKGNRDPADTARWPCDQRRLQDRLWAAALALLPEAEHVWAEFDEEPTVTGREFEPWRAILAVARLFERRGVDGLEGRMRQLMERSREERPEIVGEDRTVSVIKALLHLADIKDISDISDIQSEGVAVSASAVVSALNSIAETDETQETDWAKPRSVGRILSRLRLRREREPNKKRDRQWKISKRDLVGLPSAYGIISPGKTADGSDTNVRNDQNVRNVRRKNRSRMKRRDKASLQ